MGRSLCTRRAHLFQGFRRQGGVALHDPGGDILIAVPCGILHHDPASLPRPGPGHAHGVVVVEIGDGTFRPKSADILHPA